MRERLLNQVFFTRKLGKLLLFLSILMPLNALAQLASPNCESYIKAGKLSFILVGNGLTTTSSKVTAKYSVAYVDGEGNQTDVTCPPDANDGWDTVELDARPVTVTAYFEKDGVKSESITIVYYGFASSEVSTPYSYEGTYNAPDIVPALPTGSTVTYYSAGAAAAPVNSINSSTGVITIAGIETSSYSAEVTLPQDYNMSNGYYYFNGHGQNGLMIDPFTLAVTKRPLSECTVSLSPESITYDGSNHTPYVEVKEGTYLFNKDADYTVSYPTEITNAGDYTVTVTAMDNGRLSGSVEKTLTISPRSIEDATVTLTPTSFDYNGSEQSPSVTVALPSPKGGLEPALDPSNYTVTLTNATNAGTATVTVTGKANYTGTASATFTINKIAGSISYATASVDKTFGDAAFTNALTKTGDGGVTYSSGNTAVATVDATSGQVTIVGAGSATITATVTDGTNYTYATKTASYTLTVAAATMTVTATGYAAAYDGQAHGISVTAPDGATVKYGESATSCTLDASPTYTNAGTYTVYYEVTKANYATVTGSATVTISKAAGSISYATASVSKTFGDAAFTNALTKTGDGSVTYSSGNTAVATVDATSGQVTIVGAGSATITATVTDGTNYTYATKTASYTLTVAAATMTVTAAVYEGTYDGQAHGISVTAPEGATVKYGESATSCTLDASPTYTNAGTYTVYYEVTKANYATVTGSATVTISKAAGSISYATVSVDKTYGDAAFTNALTKTGDGSVTYSSSNTAVATVDSSTGEVTIKGDGTATITATVTDGTNYTYATKTASYTLGVGMATMTVTATGYEGIYDGQPHSIRVTAPEGAKVRYGEGVAIYTSDASPTFINAGDYTVYYEVTKENYATVTGSAVVKISKVPVILYMDDSNITTKKGKTNIRVYSTSPVGLPIVFSSSNEKVATVSIEEYDGFAELYVNAMYPGETTITATYDGGTNYESISVSFVVTVEVDAIQTLNDNQNYSFEATDYVNADGSDKPLNGVVINNIFHNLGVDNATGYDSEENCLAIGSPTSPENILGAVEGAAKFLMDNAFPSDPAEYDEWLALWSGMAFFVDAPGEGEEGVLTVESKEEGTCHIAIQPGVSDLSTFQHGERVKDDVIITPDDDRDFRKWAEENGYVLIGSDDGGDDMPVVIVNVSDGSARTKTIQKGKKSGINVKVYSVTYKVRSTSGIETIDRETKILSEDGWYDLRGQRISQPQKKGLYINNGRKIVIK